MPRPEVMAISTELIPEGSLAEMAAQVRLGSGAIAVIELFEYDMEPVLRLTFGVCHHTLGTMRNLRFT